MDNIDEIKAAMAAGNATEDMVVDACKAMAAECARLQERVGEMAEELDAARAELDRVGKASEDAFIEDLKCSGKLAPKDEAEEATWRGMFANDPEGARLLASKVPGANDGENIAGGKTGGADERSAEDMFQDDCPVKK